MVSQTFLFIRPTVANLAAYERWSGSEIQSHTWLGDMVDEVIKVDLSEGNTMIIPTGWIHAVVSCPLKPVSANTANSSPVYAPRCTCLRRQLPPFIQRCTSYVYLISSATRHSFLAELRVHEIEIATHVPKKFRFPLFTRSVPPDGNPGFTIMTLTGFAGTSVRSTSVISVPKRILPLVCWSQLRTFLNFWYPKCERWSAAQIL